ncbi:MAG: PAS domain S-box protein [Deltaproteobacteria bacterium]|nr:PAS domain S-box protein [Deltaproteobacteria bacterium]
MKQFARIVVPLTAVFVLAFVLEYRARVGADEARLLAQEAAAIQTGIHRIERELEIATRDLFLVGDLVTLAVDEPPERRVDLARSLLALLQRRPGYLRIDFIGTAGKELVRVEDTPGGPRTVPENELQDVAGRSYFVDTLQLGAGEFRVPAMDPDTEPGEAGEPYKPVVRLAMPIDDAAGQRQGVAVLHMHGGELLGGFERGAEEAGVQRMVVGSGGYWARLRPEVEPGFMASYGKGFQSALPDVWEQLVAMGEGRVESSEGLFSFGTVRWQPPLASDGAAGLEGSSWMLVSLVPRATLDATAVRVGTRLLVLGVPLLFALLVIGWLWAAAREKRRIADEALGNAEQVRSAMMTAALDAIVVMDAKGLAVEFNPMAQKIFGYTQDEVQGKLVADLIIPPAQREAHRLGLEHFLETREGPFIDKHIDDVAGMRKNGAVFPTELTICPIYVDGEQLFFGFLRDLSASGRAEVEPTG